MKDDYVVVDEPISEETGSFFLERYRKINPAVTFDTKIRPQALRVNTLRTTPEELIKQLNRRGALLEKIAFLKVGYFIRSSFSAGATPEYLFGHYYLQAPLSQLTCEALAPTKDATILDMASAPGGKTTYLAQMAPDGMVVALDNDMHRLATVRNNVERLGFLNVVCIKKDARFAKDLGMQFDFVLLDAPCSGNFCSEDGWFGKRTIQDIKNNARVQRELIKSAYDCLKPGGRMVYSTCSLEPEEDEMVVDYALKKFSDLTVVPFDPSIGDPGTVTWEGPLDHRIAGTRRFWPHKTGLEGFYIAVLEKR